MLRLCRALVLALLAQVLVTVPQAVSAQAKPDLALAKTLILEGKGAQAWALLEPYEFQLAGQPDYDYLLGVAAIAAGHPARATLALERVLAVNPNHAAARLDMGRAYFALGDYDRARIELTDLLAHDPPPAARDTIERYLAAIKARTERAGTPTVTAHVEASVGYDSNVNAGVSQNSLFLPLFGATFTLVPSVTRQHDNFVALGGGVDVAFPVHESWSLLAGADARQRSYSSLDTFDNASVELRAGVQHTGERDLTRFTVGANQYDLDNAAYRRLQSVNLEWRRQPDRSNQFTLYGQGLHIRYPQAATRSESSNTVILGAGGVHTLDEATRSFAFGNVFAGEDTATDQRVDGNRQLYGMRVGVQRALRGNADWYATLGVQYSRYALENAIFAVMRRDWQYDVALGVNWRLNDAWSLRPQLGYTRSDATTAINDYYRSELSVTLRRDWR
jgi:tetratricopeptide (TPR) repeat protein